MKSWYGKLLIMETELQTAKAVAEQLSEKDEHKIHAVKFDEKKEEFYITQRPFENDDKIATAYYKGKEIRIIKMPKI